MATGKRPKPPARRRRAHPLSDLAEAQNALEAVDPAAASSAKGRERMSPEVAGLESMKRQAVQWSADQSLQTFHGLACTVTARLDLQSVVRLVLEAGVKTVQAERGILFLGQGDDAGLVPVMAVNVKGEEIQTLEHVSRTILKMGKEGAVLLTRDAMLDPRLQDVQSVRINQVHSILCVPLATDSGRIGVLYLDAFAPHAFPPDSERVLLAFGDIAARALENARVHGDLLLENARLRQQPATGEPFDRFIGSNPAVDALRRRARMTALMDGPCLIRGERGTGRTLLARAIHEASSRSLREFVVCDCAAFASEQLKGVLFGRTGVAARGSYVEESGLLGRGNGGTLYLASAELIDPKMGNMIAQALDNGIFRPMGARHDSRVDVRLIVGTCKDLEDEVERGRFSVNLYRRARRFSLLVPALRERPGDIPELAGHFLRLYREDRKSDSSAGFTPEALRLLQTRPWSGNVGELEHVIRRALLLAPKGLIDDSVINRVLLPVPEEEARAQGPWSGMILTLTEWEHEAVRQVLAHTRGNKSEAARLLGVHRNTFVRKLKELKLS